MLFFGLNAVCTDGDSFAIHPATLKIHVLPSDRWTVGMAAANHLEGTAATGHALTCHTRYTIMSRSIFLEKN